MFFKMAVRRFQSDMERWADDQNAVVLAANKLSQLFQELSSSIRNQDGPISSQHSLFSISQEVCKCCQTLLEFTKFVKEYSVADRR